MGTVTEPERLALRQWAGEHMNELTAEGFMKSLPPKGWDDLATKSDLAVLETKIDTRFEALETKIDTKIEALETKIDTKIEALEAKIDTKVEALEAKIDTKVEALETKVDTMGTVLAATLSAQLATEIGSVRKEALRQFVALLVALIALTATSLVGETVLPHYFPAAPPQIIIQSPSE